MLRARSMPRLVITKGAGIGREVAIETECVLGRSSDATFVLVDGGISRRHCRVVAEGSSYAIEDLGSRNGTFLNGVSVVQRSALADGDLIRMGGLELVFRVQGAAAGSAAPGAASSSIAGLPRPAVAVPPVRVLAKPVPVAPAFSRRPRRPPPAARRAADGRADDGAAEEVRRHAAPSSPRLVAAPGGR